MIGAGTSPWRAKASTLYDPAYARRYRAHDDQFESSEPCRRFADWLRDVCLSFTPPIDVLDLGCGTGRYFWALSGVRELVGIDASPAMLAEARNPYNADRITAATVTLVEGDLFGHEFASARFDLIYSIGVLAEHVPLDEAVVAHVSQWLRPNGRFAFTTVHPESPSIPQTLRRRVGRSLAAVAPRTLQQRIRRRLLSGGLYADEARIEQLIANTFTIESLRRFESEAHQHCWCVARRNAA
jgi:SAM-dependent methyltransferase